MSAFHTMILPAYKQSKIEIIIDQILIHVYNITVLHPLFDFSQGLKIQILCRSWSQPLLPTLSIIRIDTTQKFEDKTCKIFTRTMTNASRLFIVYQTPILSMIFASLASRHCRIRLSTNDHIYLTKPCLILGI